MTTPTPLTMTEIAERAGVRLSAVSNWRARHRDFPKPVDTVMDHEVFDHLEVAEWLDRRVVPRNRLRPDEEQGVTYGDRFSTTWTQVTRTADRPDRSPVADLPTVTSISEFLQRRRSPAAALELLLGLIYLKACRPAEWRSLSQTTDWPQFHGLLEAAALSAGPAGRLRVFRDIDRVNDRDVVDAVRDVDRLDLGSGPDARTAEAATTILDQLERGLGRSGGHFTPADVAQLLVELCDPQPSHQVYDPYCGSGELLTAVARQLHGRVGEFRDRQLYGQPFYDWSWLTTTMNLALHGLDAELAPPGLALKRDHFPRTLFDSILCNPPFNISLPGLDQRDWPFGEPPAANANFGWLQHIVVKLRPTGRAAVVMPIGAAVAGGKAQAIRAAMVEAGTVECVIELPSRLFRYTSIRTSIWLMRSVKAKPGRSEVLFIDAGELGKTADRTSRRLSQADISRIAEECRRWRAGDTAFRATPGFSRAISHTALAEKDYVLAPARYTSPAGRPGPEQSWPELLDTRAELAVLHDRVNDIAWEVDTRAWPRVLDALPARAATTVPLGDICGIHPGPGSVVRGGWDDDHTPLVLPRNIRHGRIGAGQLDRVSQATARQLERRYGLAPGDVVTARTGTLGRFGVIMQEQKGWLVGPGCVALRPNGDVDPEYLAHYLESPAIGRWIAAHAAGSAIKHLPADTLRDLPVAIPDRETQHHVTSLLQLVRDAISVHRDIARRTTDLYDLLTGIMMPLPDDLAPSHD
jgi:type I restriction enzyme M protein